MVKVLYFYHRDPGTYGAAKSMNKMIQLLKENYNLEPIIITPFQNYVNEWATNNGIENYVVPYYHDIKYLNLSKVKNLYYRIRRFFSNLWINKRLEKLSLPKVDIVHTSSIVINIGAEYAKRKGIKHVWHIRELDRSWEFINHEQYTFMNENTEKFIVISQAVQNYWISMGLKTDKVSLVYNGLSLSSQIDSLKRNQNITILFTGFISESKGQLNFLKAVKLMSSEILSSITIDFIGDGDDNEIQKLKNFAKQIPNTEINFLGYVNDASKYFCSYDIGVINSKAEAFGRTTVEYMLAGLSVLASNTGANPELIKNGVNGLLFNYGDLKDFSLKLTQLVLDTKLREQLSYNAKKDAQDKYTDKMNAENIYQIYVGLIYNDEFKKYRV